MAIFKTVLKAIAQGSMEVLPLSRDGHMAIYRSLFNRPQAEDVTMLLVIYIAVFAAGLIYFFKEIKTICVSGVTYKGKLTFNCFISAVTAFVCSFVLSFPAEYLKQNFVRVGIVYTVTSVLTLVFVSIKQLGHGRLRENKMPITYALLIGAVAGIGILPGACGIGLMIVTTVFLGFDKKFALRYSFFAYVPVMIIKIVTIIMRSGEDPGKLICFTPDMLITFAASGVAAYFSIMLLSYCIKNKYLKYFAYYGFLIGISSIMWQFL